MGDLLGRVDATLSRVNPGADKAWGSAPSAQDWAALFAAFPAAKGGELETWFRWHNGQAPGNELLTRDLGALQRVREQGRLLSLSEALAARDRLREREDAELFEQTLPWS